MRRLNPGERVGRVVLIVALLYAALSTTAYRFRNPELSETQLFLRIPDALLWR